MLNECVYKKITKKSWKRRAVSVVLNKVQIQPNRSHGYALISVSFPLIL